MKLIIFILTVIVLLLVALSLCLLALGRQVGILFERISPMGALVNDSGPAVGQRTPAFSLPSLTGGTTVIGPGTKRSTMVFFLSPTCPVCKKLLPIVHSIRKAEDSWLDVVLASDGETAQHERFIERAGLGSYPYVVSAELGIAYRVARLPYAVLLDQDGMIRAKGLINSREQFDSLFNAFEMKFGSIQSYLDAQPAA
ncbi:methylamine dehydrogenase accessory protein MauD [Gluconacetobacter tumulicola]|uniref:Methylamine utilization protein MauD n=1 Tax=Gluconacetobacter tumulicola TaxID=1017177 RepID=A0A7W4JAK9_9PROT|nr:methylamine dehydrogenase accessory protein MauD [Gluconacetobacter tumulicola]MBB2177727.1 methylamine dehydrogenase accessory protein MauD [Gluconacetobacter tumulicola]